MFNLTDNNRKWWTLLAMSSALAVVFIDQTALAVALPAIQRDLNLSNNLLQWVINAYLLALSTLILLGGKIGDSLGHKRAFLFGIIVFISTSILCGLAQSGAWIIAARALQGLGGAFMTPSTGALVINAFPENERGKAMGLYVALAAIFLASGPLLGGALTQWFSWRAVFWVNVPISFFSIILTISAVERWQPTEKMILDYPGLILSAGFLSGYVLGFMEGPHWGWTSPTILSLFLFSTLALFAFIFWERRFAHPLVELNLFKIPIFALVTTVIVIIQAVGIVFVFWAIFLQSVLQYSPLHAGFLLLPAMAPIIIISPIAGHLRDKHGPIPPMTWGSVLVVLSLIWIGFFSKTQHYLWLLPGLLIYGIGMPLLLSGTITTVMSTVNAQQRGIAGAIVSCARQFGGSIGLAVLGSFSASLNTWKLTSFLNHAPPSLAHVKENLVDGLLVKSTLAMKAINHLSTYSVELLTKGAREAYTYAFSMTMFVAAVLAFVCLILILTVSKKRFAKT